MQRIPITGPSITAVELKSVVEAAAEGWYERANEYQERFERAFAGYLGLRFAVSLPSCTSAIHLALLALGVGAGDEVIVPDLTWIATAAPISYVGATPVFADVEADSWCLSPESFASCIGARTKAVIAVDLYGCVANVGKIREMAARHGIPVIEDAAQAIGSRREGRLAGSLGDIGVFSFHGTKTLTTGEGGMLVTNREDVYRRVLFLRDHGRAPGDRSFYNTEVAYKYKMSAVQASLGLAQLSRIDELVALKKRNFAWYRMEFPREGDLRLNPEISGVDSTYWLVTALFEARQCRTKEGLLQALADKGIEGRPFFYPLSSLPAYSGSNQARLARERNVVSYSLSPRGINLPSAMNLTRKQVHYVSQCLRELL